MMTMAYPTGYATYHNSVIVQRYAGGCRLLLNAELITVKNIGFLAAAPYR